MRSDKLQEALIEALLANETTKLIEGKIVITADPQIDNQSSIDITNERGILFGWFNDEDIVCYNTGYRNINDLEKAVKNKEYMINEFEDDEDWDVMSGDEWWDYIVKTITNSYVDNDSYMSMFLLDANNYKILYSGRQKPIINKVDEKKNKKLTAKVLPAKGYRYDSCIKLGKFYLYFTYISELSKPNPNPDIVRQNILDNSYFTNYQETNSYAIKDIAEYYDESSEDISDLITPKLVDNCIKEVNRYFSTTNSILKELGFKHTADEFTEYQLEEIGELRDSGLSENKIRLFDDPNISSGVIRALGSRLAHKDFTIQDAKKIIAIGDSNIMSDVISIVYYDKVPFDAALRFTTPEWKDKRELIYSYLKYVPYTKCAQYLQSPDQYNKEHLKYILHGLYLKFDVSSIADPNLSIEEVENIFHTFYKN